MTNYELTNKVQELHNAGRGRIAEIITEATAGGLWSEEFYIYTRCYDYTLHDNANIRGFMNIDGVQENNRGVYIPQNIIADYLKAKEGIKSGLDPDKLEAFFDAIEEAFDNLEENGFVYEDYFLQERDNAIEAVAGTMANNTGIDYEVCLEWLYENCYLDAFDDVNFNEDDFNRFLKVNKAS